MKEMYKQKKFGNFRIDDEGIVEYYIGWVSLDPKEIDDMENLLKQLRKK